MKRTRLIPWLVTLIVLIVVAALLQRWLAHRTGIPGWGERSRPVANQVVSDRAIVEQFSGHATGLSAGAYENAFRYLLEGQLNYQTAQGGMTFYPGVPSFNGRRSDGLEGLARFLPLAASWLASGRPEVIDLGGRKVSVSDLIRRGLLAGTDRDGPDFWGVVTTRHQTLVESADIALAVWISRKQVWEKLSKAEQAQVVTWLRRALEVDTNQGNWLLFPILVHRVLVALGQNDCCNDVSMQRYYADFKKLVAGGGWFNDGSLGVDYYNVWAKQYVLFWLDQIDPKFDPEFIRNSNRAMVGFYRHLVSPKGAPLWGRSICYRMATAVPLLTAQVLAPDVISKGEAMRALDATWGYFVSHGALRHGIITQGFCGQDMALVNEYTAPGSCLWGTRGLVVALYLDPAHKLLDSPREKLAVERGDFEVTESNIKWTVRGVKESAEVTLTLNTNKEDPPPPPFRAYTTKHRVREWLTHQPSRPNNHAALYDRRQYSTTQTMTACERALP